MENLQDNENTFKDVAEHVNEEVSCAQLIIESCPDQLNEDTQQEVNYISVQTESPTSFFIESAESIIEQKSETKTGRKILNKKRRGKRKSKLISSIVKQNKWQKIRYLPSKLYVNRVNTSGKPLFKSKYKCQVQTKSKYLLSVKKCVNRQSDGNGEENSYVKNISVSNSDQFQYRSCLQMSAKQVNDASADTSTKQDKDASTNTVCCTLSDVETQTSCDINTSTVGTQTDYSVIQLKYNCHFCNKVYKAMSTLEKHIKKHVRKFLKFYCKTCEKSFENGAVLANHVCVNSATPVPTITCYDNVDIVNIPVYKCGNCEAQFLTEGCYNEHKSKVHDSQEKVYTCIFCTEVLNSESALHAHLENHLLFIVS